MYIFILACGFMIQTVNAQKDIKKFTSDEMAIVQERTLNKEQINQVRKSTVQQHIHDFWDNHLKTNRP